MTKKNLSQFGHNVRKDRLVNSICEFYYYYETND